MRKFYDPAPGGAAGGGAAASQPQGGTQGQPAGGTSAPWYGEVDPQYSKIAEKFKTPGEALKSYAELQGRFTQTSQQHAEYEAFIQDEILPVFGTVENYRTWLKQVQEAKRKAEGAGAGDPNAEGLRQASGAITQQQVFLIEQAADLGAEQFYNRHPEARERKEELAQLMQSGNISIGTKPHLASSYVAALEVAWNQLAAGDQAAKQRAAKAAAVEGAGGSALPEVGNAMDMKPEDLRKQLERANAGA